MNELIYTKKISVSYDYDVAVIGGGIAGVCAAIAASLQGARVILIERFAVCGGNSTSGGVASFCGNTVGVGQVFDMIVSSLEQFNAIAPLNSEKSSRVFDHEILAVILQELLIRNNVKLLLHTRLIDVITKSRLVSECIIAGKSGIEAVRAKVFIDCSGEGDIARFAGFKTMKGNNKGYSLPMSFMYFIRHSDKNHTQIPQGWFENISTEENLPMTSIWPYGEGGNAIKIKVPMYDACETESLTNAEIAARRKMMSVIDFHQRHQGRPWLFDHASPIIGIREGCRILGDYVLKVADLRAGAHFADAVAVGTFYLDGHKPDDDKRTYILPKDELYVPPYDIPLRSLTARDADNLMMAGRCISADQLALSSARVTTTCAMTGQAAGITSALAALRNKQIRDIDAAEIREKLAMGGAIFDKEKIKSVYRAKS